ncbi:MAG: hypothetical protein ACREM3_24405 [Candidatus Rokuibacteriota bacterium]
MGTGPLARGGLLLLVLSLLLVAPVTAGLRVPPGFTVRVYVTGQGFSAAAGYTGMPSSSTMGFDETGVLYMARTGRRYVTGGEIEDLWRLYRIPSGGGRLTPDNEKAFLHGPPLPNPQVALVRGGRDLFVTTYDRDRKVGVVYSVRDGRAEWFAGGTPARGQAPLLQQPEGAAADRSGNLYVADREQGVIVKLDPTGRVLEPRWLVVTRPRTLAMDQADHLWVGSDGGAPAPWQQGPGMILRVDPNGEPHVVVRGPVAAALAIGPGGRAFVADRHNPSVFILGPDGTRTEFAQFTNSDAPRSLTFAPVTPATRQAGIAGDLFVVTIKRGAWPVNEVLRISGPFEELTGAR